MDAVHLPDLAREHLRLAHDAGAGRSAVTLHGGHEHSLRQTLIALVAGRQLDEHENPGEATVHVVVGRVALVSGEDSLELSAGQLVVVPDHRHRLDALADSVVLLTVAMRLD